MHQVVPALRRDNKFAHFHRGAGTLVRLPRTKVNPSDWWLCDFRDRDMGELGEPLGSGSGGKGMRGARRECRNQYDTQSRAEDSEYHS
jgi:hypothetical protein